VEITESSSKLPLLIAPTILSERRFARGMGDGSPTDGLLTQFTV